MIHFYSRLFLSLLSISFMFSITSAHPQKAGDLKIEPYVFEAASKEKVEAELGRLRVPENRLNPRSKLIELAFVRFKSTAQKPGPPIIYLAGGPGGSAIAAVRGSRFLLFLSSPKIQGSDAGVYEGNDYFDHQYYYSFSQV